MISVVIPVYNGSKFLASTLRSLLAQTNEHWEAIVVNDGSHDNSLAIANDFADKDNRFRVVSGSNHGVAAARNRGAAEISSATESVMFLDQDDTLMPTALEILQKALDVDYAAVGACGLARKFDGTEVPSGADRSNIQNYDRYKWVNSQKVISSRSEPTTLAIVVNDNVICTPGSALIRKSALMAVRQGDLYFIPDAVPLDDWDFWLRLTKLGYIAFVDQVVINWRRHSTCGSMDTGAMRAAELRIREGLSASAVDPDIMEIANRRLLQLRKTNHRRVARDHFRKARRAIVENRFRNGLEQCIFGTAQYLRYLVYH